MSDSKLREFERLGFAGDPDASLRSLRERVRAEEPGAAREWAVRTLSWEDEHKRLRLQTPYLQACTRYGFTPNHFSAVIKQGEYIDLGETVIVEFVTWRPVALQVTEDGKRESFDLDSDLFKEIVDLSQQRHSGAMFGPQFLVWVPAIEELLSMFCYTKSMKRTLSNFNPVSTKLIGQTKELYVTRITTHRHEWWTAGIRDALKADSE